MIFFHDQFLIKHKHETLMMYILLILLHYYHSLSRKNYFFCRNLHLLRRYFQERDKPPCNHEDLSDFYFAKKQVRNRAECLEWPILPREVLSKMHVDRGQEIRDHVIPVVARIVTIHRRRRRYRGLLHRRAFDGLVATPTVPETRNRSSADSL